MSNLPLNSNDQSKILIFGLLMLPTIVFLVGVIPVLFLAFGIYMMKRNEDFSHIVTATRNFRGYVILILIGCLIFPALLAAFLAIVNRSISGQFYFILAGCVGAVGTCLVYLYFLNFLFINPLSRHSEWVELNGIFSTKQKKVSEAVALGELNIIKGEKLKQYSVADELIKWAKLKEDGHISDEEFDEARKKLLKRA